MGEHLIAGEFQSDKYLWCKRGFVPLKLTDESCHELLWEYADIRREIDPEFADDLQEALILEGYRGCKTQVVISAADISLFLETELPYYEREDKDDYLYIVRAQDISLVALKLYKLIQERK